MLSNHFMSYLSALTATSVVGNYSDLKLDWWQKSVIYQVYPRSFKDSDEDGIGDLKGIEEMAEYFQYTGIGTIWLSPIFKSPMADFGYDISDFNDIDETFGTMDDFKNLLNKLKLLGVRLLLDFVPNHSSDEHEWFKKSIKRIDPYTNYYIWKDGKADENGNRIPPNNWRSNFQGSAWEWSPERGQYYLHQFTIKQPELNFRSPILLDEMKNVLRFWLDMGIDGFRVDAVPFIIEDEFFRDEPLLDPNSPDDNLSYNLLNHIYTRDQLMTYEIIEEFREVLDEFTAKDGNTRLLLTEAYAPMNFTMLYYSQEKPRAHMPFNFNFITYFNISSSAEDINNIIHLWLDNIPKGQWPNWVIGNHDNKRVASRLSQDMVDPMNMLNMMLPGTAVTYNGEEIGMSDAYLRFDQTVDPWAKAFGPLNYNTVSRDPARTPFHWNNTQNAGFSRLKKTWLPVNSNYWINNLKLQKKNNKSYYKTYKKLVQLRKKPTISHGDLTTYVLSKWVFAFSRKLNGYEDYYIILNIGTEQEEITLNSCFSNLSKNINVQASSLNSVYKEGQIINPNDILVMTPKSSIVLSSE
ncbi:maltase 2-like [Daktulosphaira vitifoliae]|uniref:maltase 2-like n=1 Tax=Daktulosphaira vitifoliae TaxID=58002 RepID=UPI0021A9CB34|nr:maltase 2-like [Daktulosphaira vitifoliae]XP_050545177.1 maltase 2-like [Daktulosphaira vitifoliae]